ncbi:MAG: hypothetical protein ACYTAN_18355 [Planctomycetota bacterium]|jgi:sugar (pentulose or hexulose) kinase
MALWRSGRGGFRRRGLLAALAAALLIALVPAGVVVYFLSATVTNERLAIRQKLTDIYTARLEGFSRALDDWWSANLAQLEAARELPPAEAFREIVVSGAAQSAVIFDESGRVVYPISDVVLPDDGGMPSDAWVAARRLEFEEDRPGEAADAYLAISQTAEQPGNEWARALAAAARCLITGTKPSPFSPGPSVLKRRRPLGTPSAASSGRMQCFSRSPQSGMRRTRSFS